MIALIPCTACKRHVRRAETQCPFCGAQRTPSAGPFREAVIPEGAKRATILAIGMTLAGQGCGGQTEGTNSPAQAGTGASVGYSGGGTGGVDTGAAGYGANGGTANYQGYGGAAIATTPPYGLSIQYPYPDGNAGSTSLPEDAGAVDGGADDGGVNDAAPPDDAGSSDPTPDDAGN